MAWVAGVDGCRAGWFRACRNLRSGAVRFDVLPDIEAVLARPPVPGIVALDIPIGLPRAGARACDRAARRVLGPRRSSVFPAPVRGALRARSREEASRITERLDGRKVGVQAWAIHPKICQVDDAMRSRLEVRSALREVHPEVSFWAWNGSVPMEKNKRSRNGRSARRALAEAWLEATDVLAVARREHPKKDLADDDILDAIAALWTAHRIAKGVVRTLPSDPPRDALGLPMEIVY